MTEPHPQVQIFRSTATDKDFKNANIGDWIQGVGTITTEYEKNFIRRFGSAKESSDVLDDLMELVKEDLREDFDGELYITHEDLLFDISKLRTKEREQG